MEHYIWSICNNCATSVEKKFAEFIDRFKVEKLK